MAKNVEHLIEDLAHWHADDFARESPRDRAITKLKARGPQVVPVLIERLENLLAASAHHGERVQSIKGAWDSWYERFDGLDPERDGIDAYRAAGAGVDLPDPAEIDAYREPHELKQGIVEALHRIGDQRAGAVLTAALADQACVQEAAKALQRIRHEDAVPPLLDALAGTIPNGSAIDDIMETLRSYDVSPGTVEERFRAEVSPRGRANLMELLATLATEGTVSASTFIHAAADPEKEVRWAVANGLKSSWQGFDPEAKEVLILLALDDEESVSWRAVQALNTIEHGSEAVDKILSHHKLTPAIVSSAITLAARREQSERVPELIARLGRAVRTQRVAAEAVRQVITRVPEPPANELCVALELLSPLKSRINLDNPMSLLHALHSLSSHPDPDVGSRALTALRSGDLLFTQMMQDDDVLRDEANAIFEAIARAGDRARFERFSESQPQRSRPKRRRLFWRRRA